VAAVAFIHAMLLLPNLHNVSIVTLTRSLLNIIHHSTAACIGKALKSMSNMGKSFNYANTNIGKSCISKHHAPKRCIKEVVITLKIYIEGFSFFILGKIL
jgi:hypothetical protein